LNGHDDKILLNETVQLPSTRAHQNADRAISVRRVKAVVVRRKVTTGPPARTARAPNVPFYQSIDSMRKKKPLNSPETGLWDGGRKDKGKRKMAKGKWKMGK
jgi:hypothetical protein